MANTTRFTKTDDTFVDVTTGTTLDSSDYPSGWSATDIKSVDIGSNVTSIGVNAFLNCIALQNVTIGDSVTSIGAGAFTSCTTLKSVIIGDSVTSIGRYAFADCTTLQSVTIGDSVTSIGYSAFSFCSALQSLTIGNSVTSIGRAAFNGCTALQSLTIPNSVTSIGDYAFWNCTSLQSVTIPDSVTSIGTGVFYNCYELQYVTIGNSVTSIGLIAFAYCRINSVTLPDSVTSIGDYAFEYSRLNTLTINSSSNLAPPLSAGVQTVGGKTDVNVVVNGSPVFTSTAVTSVDEGSVYSYTVTVTDTNNDTVTITATTKPNWLSFNTTTNVLSGTPTSSDVGSHSVVLTASDGLLSTTQPFSIVVYGPPKFTSNPVISVAEGTLYSYTVTTSDPNGDTVTVTATIPTASQSWLSFDGTTLSGTPTSSDIGGHDIVLTANDGLLSTTQSFTIVVNGPVFTSTAVTSATQDVVYSYTVTTTDPNGDIPIVTATTIPSWLSFNTSTNVLSGTPTSSDVGSNNVVLTASDGSISTLQSFIIEVKGPPKFTSNPVTSVDEGSAYSYTVTTTDPNGDSVTVTATIPTASQSWLSFDGTTLTGTPTSSDVGIHNIVLTASDGLFITTQSFTIEVKGPPKFTSNPVLSVAEGTLYSYTITTSDPNGDSVTVTATTIPSWLSFNTSTNVLSGTPTSSDVGSHNVVLTASDGSLSTTQSFKIVVNGPPVFTSTAVTSVDEGSVYSYTVTTTDPNGDTVTVTATTIPSWLIFKGTTLTGIPRSNDVGSNNVVLTASDGLLSTTQTFTIVVYGPPKFTSNPVVSVAEETLYSYTVTTTDLNGDTVTVTATIPTASQSWLSFDGTTLSGTPTSSDIGGHDIVLTANDGLLSTTQSFTIVVNGPAFTSTAVTSATQDVVYSYTVTTTDPNGDIPIVTATTIPSWLSFDGTTLSGTPTSSNIGSNNVVLTASDGSISTLQSFTIEVNGLPVFTSNPVTSVYEGSAYSYKVTTTDPNGDSVTVTATTIPSWLSFNTSTNVLSGTPTSSDVGTYSLVLSATDGKAFSTQSFTIYVNGPPIFTSTPITTATQGIEYRYTITISDPNLPPDTMFSATPTAITIPNWLRLETGFNTILVGTPTSSDVGSHKVVLSISDGTLSTRQSFTITVRRFKPTTTTELQKGVNKWYELANDGSANAVTKANNYEGSEYYGNPNTWDLSLIMNLSNVFNGKTQTNHPDITTWNVSNVTNMSSMFEGTTFNEDISGWIVSKVTNMDSMFKNAIGFNHSIGGWNVSSVTNMKSMFEGASIFNKNIASWNVSNVTNMSFMFNRASLFNQPIGRWVVSNVTNMSSMFENASVFNEPIDTWNVSSVTYMIYMFRNAIAFNQNIGDWNVSQVTNMSSMFENARAFDHPIGHWERQNGTNGAKTTSTLVNVTNMSSMFQDAIAFNQNIGDWNVSGVTNMDSMFRGTSTTNQNIKGWTVSNVTTMSSMFEDATTFDEDLNNWTLKDSNVVLTNMFAGAAMNGRYGFSLNTPLYSEFSTRSFAPNTKNALIYGIAEWLKGVNGNGSAYNYELNIESWNIVNVTDFSGLFKNGTTYTDGNGVSQTLNSTTFTGSGDGSYTLGSISNWSVAHVTNMSSMFDGATSFNVDINSWDVSKVTNMSAMFNSASKFDKHLNAWDVSQVTNMSSMFQGASKFNKNISSWKVSNVTNMSSMFRDAILFNEDLNNWERSDSTLVNVVNMDSMFYNSEVFNHDIGKWNVSSVTNMSSMFRDAIVFNNGGNNNMKNWDVSSVTTMDFMFYNCGALNEDIGRWNVSSVVNMSSMFQGAAIFNQNITQWNISSVTNMNNMFQDAVVFDQNIRHWDTLGATTYDSMFDSANAMIATYNGVTGFGTTPTSSFFSLGFSTKTIGNIVEVIFSGTGSLTSTTVTNGIATVLPIGAGNILKVLVIGYDSVGTAFQNNTNINVVDLNGVVKNTGQTQGLDASAFSGCTNLSEITLFHYCEVVGSLAFNNATSLKKIYEIPSGLTSVASDAFNGTNVNVKTIFDITNGVTNRDASSSSATLIFNPSSPKTKTNVQQTYDVTVTGTLDSDINYVATKVFLETINAGFVPNNNAELKMAVEKWFGGIINAGSVVPSGQGSGNYGNMSTWNISKVTNMSEVFRGVTRSFTSAEDITGWDVTNVTNMSSMFHGATRFNQNIGSWDVSNVIDMSSMFHGATGFNQNIGSWDVSNVIDMSSMFHGATGFNQNIGSWDVSNVIDMSSMFQDATGFNQNIGSWDVSSVTNMSHMFYDTTLFNQNIVGWTVSNVINMSYMFQGATLFNQDINVWIVNSNTNLTNMFLNSGITNGTYGFSVPTPTYLQFDQPVPLVDGPKTQIGTLKWAVTTFLNGGWTTQYQSTYGTTMNDWNVFYVTNMNDIFQGASTFNENISKWKVSNVTNMSAMFDGASLFNQDISLWDVSNVTDMSLMFWNATAFNEPIVNWDTSNVTDMGFMFRNARSFNKNIDGWDVSSVTNMRNMFQGSLVFNQFIGDWNVSSVINMSYMFDGAIVFNQSLNNWVVSNITGFFTKGATCSDNNSGEGMKCMFKNATSFNQPLDKWDVKKVITMESMFEGASSFNQDVSAWKPLNVKTLKAMFKDATYYNNNPTAWIESQALVGNPRRGTNNIDTWGKPNHRKGEAYRAVISNVEDFSSMFENALTFDRRIISWPISQTDCLTNMVKNSGLSNIDSLGQGFNNISTPTYTYFNKVVCFNEGTRILCLKGGKDQYIRIGRLKVGDRVKTLNHGYKKIIDLRKGNYRLNRLADMGIYKMKKQGNMIADLEMTGLHCILVDPNDSKYADDIKRQGGLKNEKFFVDGKFRLRANQSHEFEQMECKDYTIYSFALEDQQEQYGIWANGVLAETTSKRILEISNMQKIGSLKKDTFSIFSK